MGVGKYTDAWNKLQGMMMVIGVYENMKKECELISELVKKEELYVPMDIKLLRYKHYMGLTNQMIAKRIGVSSRMVSHWISGNHYPKKENIDKLNEMIYGKKENENGF